MYRIHKLVGLCAGLVMLSACGQDPQQNPDPKNASQANGAGPQVAETRLVGVPLASDPARQLVSSNSQNAKCNIELIAGKSVDGVIPELKVTDSDNVKVEAWYIDVANGDIGQDLKFVIHNEDQSKFWVASVSERSERKDVDGAQGGTGAFNNAGVSISVDLTQQSPGFYGMYLDGSAGVCALGRGFKLN